MVVPLLTFAGVRRVKVDGRGSHLSSLMRTSLPDWTLHLTPLSTIFLPHKILLHMKEQNPPSLASMKVEPVTTNHNVPILASSSVPVQVPITPASITEAASSSVPAAISEIPTTTTNSAASIHGNIGTQDLTNANLSHNAVATPNQLANSHPMQTRAKSGIHKPKVYMTIKIPKTVKEALQDEQWNKAMSDELLALIQNATYTLVPLPPGREPIGCKWIFRHKENSDGTHNKFKARLVAKGFHQQPGFDFTETFSPVVKPVTIRIFITLALSHGWCIKKLDVNNAFINGDLKEEVYMVQPPGFEVQASPPLVCKLHKALYGLKLAPRACDLKVVTNIITALNIRFSLKELGDLHYFLGIEVNSTPSGLHLSQAKYARDLLIKAQMQEAKPSPTSMTTGVRLSAHGSEPMSDPQLYRSIVGALQYLLITRPDLSFSVNKVCQFMHNPLLTHWLAAKRILRYLSGTISHGLHIKRPIDHDIGAFCDADWATDPDDRRSTSGFTIFFGENIVLGNAKSNKRSPVQALKLNIAAWQAR
uniref:Reverse transcriptase Ty1/copia-type domain-containing protein n=1 Tax=Cannabis sativa TaxID=3483 RepID=A0A803P494_CANSA